jgi:hypothetical protein
MLHDIISDFATCTILWAPDFFNWKSSVDIIYPLKIDNITNYDVFWCYLLATSEIKSFSDVWKLRFVLYLFIILF